MTIIPHFRNTSQPVASLIMEPLQIVYNATMQKEEHAEKIDNEIEKKLYSNSLKN